MALDTARVVTDTVAAHLSDHNTLHTKHNNTYDVVADYSATGDGSTNDAAEIQAAVDAAEAAGGGDVLFPSLTFRTTAAITVNSDNVRLIGIGQATIERTGTGNAITITGVDANNKVSGIQIRNLTITGPSVEGTQVSGNGIAFDFADDCHVEGVDVSGFGNNGDQGSILIRRSTKLHIVNSNLHDSRNGLVTGTTSSPTIPEADRCEFRGCNAYDNWDDGIHSQFSTRMSYSDNRCYGNGEAGIDVLGDDSDAIVGNVCYNNGGNGIEGGNTTASGTPDTHHSIVGNTCQGNGSHGIVLTDDSELCTITGNTCSDNTGSGIQLSGAGNGSINHTVSGNVCEGNTQRGIYLVNAPVTDCLVTGNIARNNSNRGIYIANAGGGAPAGNVITANYAEGNTTGDIDDNVGGNTVRGNYGADITENSGTATLASGTTSIQVAHGVNKTPQVLVTPIETLNSASFFWVSNIGAANFTINVNTDPGQDVDFAWYAR